ncbi:MAG: tripartite tricarboxylate transporter substrate binding protein [Sphingomonadaceae bacterium]
MKKLEFPTKGKSITVIVPWAAGGANDIGARVLSSGLEKEFGTPVEVVNRAGASGQVGTTELAKAKPDGYTVGVTAVPSTNTIYLDPDRKAAFGRKDLIPVAMHTMDPVAIAVKADSPIKTVKDLIEAAKANPGRLKVGSSGVMNVNHLAILLLEKEAGVKFAVVQFDGGAQQPTALLGGHIDAAFDQTGTFMPQVKSGGVRLIGVMDTKPNKFVPEVPTLESQGYKVYMSSGRGWSLPAGTPKEIVDFYSSSIKKVLATEEQQKKMDEMGIVLRYMDSAEFASYWDQLDKDITPLIPLAKQQ